MNYIRHKCFDKKVDLCILSTSFEERWYSSFKDNYINSAETLVLHQGGNYESIDQGMSFLNEVTALDVIDFDLGSSSSKYLCIKDSLIKRIESCSGVVVIDISTFTRENLLILFYFIKSGLNRDNVYLIYSEVEEYAFSLKEVEDKWLSKGVKEVRSVLGYPGIIFPSRSLHLVILSGFELDRAKYLIEAYEPAFISIGTPDTNSHFNGSHYAVNQFFHKELLLFVTGLRRHNSNVFEFGFSCSDPISTEHSILSHLEKFKGYNTILCPLNTKISTIGCALAALKNESIQLCYIEPLEYNFEGYSKTNGFYISTSIKELAISI